MYKYVKDHSMPLYHLKKNHKKKIDVLISIIYLINYTSGLGHICIGIYNIILHKGCHPMLKLHA